MISYFYTIEGNTSSDAGVVRNGGCVAKKRYHKGSNKGKVLFGHPKYDTEQIITVTTTAEKATGENNKVAKMYAKSIAGTYVVTGAEALNIRNGYGKDNTTVLGSIPKDKEVKCYGYYTDYNDTRWLYVKYYKYVGFVSGKYLKKK